jgi:hypothetical protein
MKIQHIIPLLLLAGGITVGAQTTNTTSNTKTMSYTLRNMQNDKTIPNPTDEDICAAMASLKDDFGPALVLETSAGDQPLSMDEVEKGKFGFTCQDGKVTYMSKEGHECSTDVAIKILIAYRDGKPDWKTMGDWKQLKM